MIKWKSLHSNNLVFLQLRKAYSIFILAVLQCIQNKMILLAGEEDEVNTVEIRFSVYIFLSLFQTVKCLSKPQKNFLHSYVYNVAANLMRIATTSNNPALAINWSSFSS